MRLGALVDRYPSAVPDLYPPERECPACGNYERACECASEEEDDSMSSLTFDQSVATRIRAAMEQEGVSEAELARRVGVRPETVRDWSTGSGFPSSVFHASLARALGGTVEWLIKGEIPQDKPAEFPYHCQDCGSGMLEHGVCLVGDAVVCFFCAKKRGHLEQAPAESAPTKEPSRAKRARRKPTEMRVTSETGITVLEQPFLDDEKATPVHPACDCGCPEDCRCDPRPEDCGTHCNCTSVDEGTQAPESEPVTWRELLAERRQLDARKKAVVDEAEARMKAIDEQLWPHFSDEQPRLEHDGYTLTRVVPEPRVTVTWDVERALESRQGEVLRAMLLPYRSEQVKASKPYLKGSIAKGTRS